nr:hypothetical protein [Delftia sp. PE138]
MQVRCHCLHRCHDGGEAPRLVRIFRPVDGYQRKTAITHAHRKWPSSRLLRIKQRCVKHYIACAYHFFTNDSFGQQIIHCRVSRSKKQTGNMIGYYAIYFFWHRSIPGTQSSFDMCHWNMELYSRQGSCHRRISIPIHQYPIRSLVLQNGFDLLDHSPRHRSMREASQRQHPIRLWNSHLIKKHIGHVFVKVLTGMNDHFSNIHTRCLTCSESMRYNGCLDHLRTRPNNRKNLHTPPHHRRMMQQ